MKSLNKKRIETFYMTDLADADPEWYIKIRQATQAEHELRAELFAVTKQTFAAGEGEGATAFTVESRFSYPEQQRKETFLVLGGCNIPIEDDQAEAGQRDLFRFKTRTDGLSVLDMDERQFKAAWGLLPVPIADWIHRKVIAVNEIWDPNYSRRLTTNSGS